MHAFPQCSTLRAPSQAPHTQRIHRPQRRPEDVLVKKGNGIQRLTLRRRRHIPLRKAGEESLCPFFLLGQAVGYFGSALIYD